MERDVWAESERFRRAGVVGVAGGKDSTQKRKAEPANVIRLVYGYWRSG